MTGAARELRFVECGGRTRERRFILSCFVFARRCGVSARIDRTTKPLRPLQDREFGLLRSLIREEAGIELSGAKRALVEGRLNCRLRALGLETYYDYYRILMSDQGSERQRMLDCITTNETSFFRESAHFELLERVLIPRWKAEAQEGRRSKDIRVWSAGCSTGEEPYSVGMCLRHAFPSSYGWQLEIIASDISKDVLERATAGVYPLEAAKGIPKEYLERFMLRGRGREFGKMKAGAELQAIVKFARLNLNDPQPTSGRKFDLILCRNVLIYFGRVERMRVINRFLDLLVGDGLLLLGHAESLQGETDRVHRVRPSVYELSSGKLRAIGERRIEVIP